MNLTIAVSEMPQLVFVSIAVLGAKTAQTRAVTTLGQSRGALEWYCQLLLLS
jgi:hypothetical protein